LLVTYDFTAECVRLTTFARCPVACPVAAFTAAAAPLVQRSQSHFKRKMELLNGPAIRRGRVVAPAIGLTTDVAADELARVLGSNGEDIDAPLLLLSFHSRLHFS
jgi:hypothetical protein